MEKGTLTREEAIREAGLEAVERVEAENCEPTNRVGYNGYEYNDSLTEWSSSVTLEDGRTLIAYYYTNAEQDRTMADFGGDGSSIDWEVAGYEIA